MDAKDVLDVPKAQTTNAETYTVQELANANEDAEIPIHTPTPRASSLAYHQPRQVH